MPVISVILDGDNAWPDLEDLPLVMLASDVWRLAVLEGGMASGKPSLALRLEVPGSGDESTAIVAETSMQAWIAATVVLRARFPQMFAGTPLE